MSLDPLRRFDVFVKTFKINGYTLTFSLQIICRNMDNEVVGLLMLYFLLETQMLPSLSACHSISSLRHSKMDVVRITENSSSRMRKIQHVSCYV